MLVQLRSYICNSISRLFAKHTDAHHAGSARELKSYALYMYTNEKSHNACGRKWVRWKRNRSDSTDYGSRDITHKTGLHQGFGYLEKNCLRHSRALHGALLRLQQLLRYYTRSRYEAKSRLCTIELEQVFRNFRTETQKLL